MAQDFSITTLRGGVNNSDPPSSIPNDQVVEAENVEFYLSMLGERRQGSSAISIPAALSGVSQVSFLHRHLPTLDEADAELWALGATISSSLALQRKTTAWAAVTISDTATNSGIYPFIWRAQTLHGKLFIAYKSNKDRLHVWDGTSLRRAGMAAPTAAPTAVDTGAGTFSGVRYYRTRETVQSGGVTLRRSEPSPVLTKTPSGTGTGLIVTKPADMGENATHWELEASVNNADFYRIATTVVGTSTVTDSTAYTTGYAISGVLSEDIEDYDLIWSPKYLGADADRLLFLGSYEQTAKGSRFGWTPVLADPGVGNDERIPLDTDNFIDLDGFEGGEGTGLSRAVDGVIFIAKVSQIYKATRTGQRERAYEAIALSKTVGALPDSMVEAVDQSGKPCIYFLDPKTGPWRAGASGLVYAGHDIRATWARVNIDATQVVSKVYFYPDKKQIHWAVAVDGSNTPNFKIILQTNETEETQDGLRKGWTTSTGPSAAVLASCLFASNVDSGIARNKILKPLIGIASGAGHNILMMDSGTTDDGTAFAAHITTRPYMPVGLCNRFGVRAAALLGVAQAGAAVNVTVIRDFGIETLADVRVNLDPALSEAHVIKQIDNLIGSELYALQIKFSDVTNPSQRWQLNRFDMKPRLEEEA